MVTGRAKYNHGNFVYHQARTRERRTFAGEFVARQERFLYHARQGPELEVDSADLNPAAFSFLLGHFHDAQGNRKFMHRPVHRLA
jgi:hypothetical protein